ncbi:MAG: D-glycero-beta-D-manno-heptose 1-phosphate adenylyltransferase [Planctomycetes bacterium]|nr:D-glycero-beta-D-manno-heptose 1-phosphate adenylyltransferase [Planctomycetota bacterium]MCB9889600.1 D-glycero-beta-D-manno-heptose 1-phosphate adenylyltransferase [Planctomycetota bacterium]
MEPLARVLRDLPDVSILVLGDLIVDRYIEGVADRVSPEAPVLVFETHSERFKLGGAGNVAANLVSLGAKATVLGVVGEDATAQQLGDLLREVGVETAHLVTDPTRPTTRKTRYVSRTAQVMRVDAEKRHAVGGDAARSVLEILAERPFRHSAILISDYGKGMVTRPVVEAAIAAARSVGGPVVVDPKGKDYSLYHGVDLMTPNQAEAEAATGIAIRGHDDLLRVAERLKSITGVKTATVTLGKDGIFYESGDGEARIIPTEARAVFDVTGAGDTVVAMLALARASKVDMHDSIRLANMAAGITVGRFGTYAVKRDELLALLGQTGRGKILTRAEAVSAAARLRAQDQRLVFTNGCFDILHPGHTDYLARARAYGDALMVAVNTDESVRRQEKGSDRPVNSLQDRMDVLAALHAVDFVVPFDDDTPLDLIEAVTPHVLVKGEDWRDRGVVGRDWVETHGGQVVLVPLRQGSSTTSIIERIRATGPRHG